MQSTFGVWPHTHCGMSPTLGYSTLINCGLVDLGYSSHDQFNDMILPNSSITTQSPSLILLTSCWNVPILLFNYCVVDHSTELMSSQSSILIIVK